MVLVVLVRNQVLQEQLAALLNSCLSSHLLLLLAWVVCPVLVIPTAKVATVQQHRRLMAYKQGLLERMAL